MRISPCLHACVAVTGIVAAGVTAAATAAAAPTTAAPSTAAPSPPTQPPPAAYQGPRPAAVTVPPGGLVTSFLRNQVTYCAIICPLAVQTAAAAAATTLQAPQTFLAAARHAEPARAIGITAASITGPTDAAAEKTILADGTEVAPRALNAFEVGVVGLLDIGAAAASGPPAVADAIQTARQDTYTALNRPIVPNPTPTVAPKGVVQVTTIAVIDVGAAVIFPAFNDVLSGAFQTPDAAARELAVTGDPARAVTAGADTVARTQTEASTVIAAAIADARHKIDTATAAR